MIAVGPRSDAERVWCGKNACCDDGGTTVFDPAKLHVRFADGVETTSPLSPRRYTLTHSDLTGDLFLTIGADFDQKALRALQVRLERDEVLGEWVDAEEGPRLELRMAAQGGLPIFGTGAMRCDIFRGYRPVVVGAIHYGDRGLTEAHPMLDDAPVVARFTWRDGRVTSEEWGRFGDWR